MKTLREICDELNVSRRAVQGYEKMGLVAACKAYQMSKEDAEREL